MGKKQSKERSKQHNILAIQLFQCHITGVNEKFQQKNEFQRKINERKIY